MQLLRHHWVPDHLHNPVTLGVVVAAFAGADLLRPEAGLFAATVLGMGLANQSSVPVRHITAFGESLGLLIVASLFVVLGAAVDADRMAELALPSVGIIAVRVLVARPAAVWASTIGSDLLRGDRRFLAAMAPRGIVAAAIASIFALELAEQGRPSEVLVPVTFTVILGTVVIYGLGAGPAARWFRVERGPAQTVALVGPQPWALQLAEALISSHVEVMLITTDEDEIVAAAERSIRTFNVRVDSEEFDEAVDFSGISKAIALSGSEELNTLWTERLA